MESITSTECFCDYLWQLQMNVRLNLDMVHRLFLSDTSRLILLIFLKILPKIVITRDAWNKKVQMKQNKDSDVVQKIRWKQIPVKKSIIFWDMTPFSPLSFNWRFGGTYRLHIQGRRNRFSKPASKQVASRVNPKYLSNLKLSAPLSSLWFYSSDWAAGN
jgi:hypothetical protein